MEQAVAEIWESALGLSKIGIDDDFFDRGNVAGLNHHRDGDEQALAIPLDTSIVTGARR